MAANASLTQIMQDSMNDNLFSFHVKFHFWDFIPVPFSQGMFSLHLSLLKTREHDAIKLDAGKRRCRQEGLVRIVNQEFRFPKLLEEMGPANHGGLASMQSLWRKQSDPSGCQKWGRGELGMAEKIKDGHHHLCHLRESSKISVSTPFWQPSLMEPGPQDLGRPINMSNGAPQGNCSTLHAHCPGSGHHPNGTASLACPRHHRGTQNTSRKSLQSTVLPKAWHPGQKSLCLSLGSLLCVRMFTPVVALEVTGKIRRFHKCGICQQ